MTIDEKIAEYKADIEKCERVYKASAIGSIRDAAIRKADDCKEMVEWLEELKQLREQASSSEEPNKWIPLISRPMTEEEREEYKGMAGVTENMILNCPLPDDGQEVLVSYGDYVCIDTFHDDDGCYFEDVEIDEVDAWMPLPLPWKAESEEEE